MKKLVLAILLALATITTVQAEEVEYEMETVTITAEIDEPYKAYTFDNYEYVTAERLAESTIWIDGVMVLENGKTIRDVSGSWHLSEESITPDDDDPAHFYGYSLIARYSTYYRLWFATDYTNMPTSKADTWVEMERGDVAVVQQGDESPDYPLEVKVEFDIPTDEVVAEEGNNFFIYLVGGATVAIIAATGIGLNKKPEKKEEVIEEDDEDETDVN